MFLVRSAKRLLDGSKLIVLAVLVAVVFFTAGFVELAMARRQLEAHYLRAQEQVERTRRQNTLLQVQLERAQRGDLLRWEAWGMYRKLPKGVGVIQTEPGPVKTEKVDQPKAPIWKNWLKSLGIN